MVPSTSRLLTSLFVATCSCSNDVLRFPTDWFNGSVVAEYWPEGLDSEVANWVVACMRGNLIEASALFSRHNLSEGLACEWNVGVSMPHIFAWVQDDALVQGTAIPLSELSNSIKLKVRLLSLACNTRLPACLPACLPARMPACLLLLPAACSLPACLLPLPSACSLPASQPDCLHSCLPPNLTACLPACLPT